MSSFAMVDNSSLLSVLDSWLKDSPDIDTFTARTSLLNELYHRRLLPIFVKPVYYQLIQDILKWLDDPTVNSSRSGIRYKCLDGLVNYTLDQSILTPYAFLDLKPLTLQSVLFCVENCYYIYSPSRLVDFLCCLGVRTSRGRLVSYNTIYPWPLHYLDSKFLERKADLFKNCFSGQSKYDRKLELTSLMFDFIEQSQFKTDFLIRLDSNNF